MKEYVVKFPIGGYGVMAGQNATYALIVRNSLGDNWRIYSLYKTKEEAESVTPTYVTHHDESMYDDNGLRIYDDYVPPTAPYRYKFVKPVMGYANYLV